MPFVPLQGGPEGQGRRFKPLQEKPEEKAYRDERAKAKANLQKTHESYERSGLGAVEAATVGPWSPVMGEVVGGIAGAGNEAVNLLRRAKGEAPVSSRAIYEANRDATDEYFREIKGARPKTALAGDIAASVVGGEAAVKALGAAKKAPAAVAAAKAVGGTKTGQLIKGIKAAADARVAPIAAAIGERVAPGILDYGGKVARAVRSGAIGGAGLGFLEGSDLEERTANAVEGGKTGALWGGLLESVAAPVAGKLFDVAKDVGRGAGRAVAPKRAPGAPPSVDDTIQAAQAAAGLAAKKRVTSANIMEGTEPFEGKGQMFAERLGTEGERNLATLARRPGATGDEVRRRVQERAQASGARIMDDFSKLGVTPETARGDLESLVASGREKAGHLYGPIEQDLSGVMTPELDELMTRPAVADALEAVRESGRNARRGSQAGLTMGRVEVPEAPGVHPLEAPPVGDFLESPGAIPAGPARAPSRGFSLMDWVRRQGGAVDEGGDLGAMGLGGLGARSKLSPQELDDLASRAEQAGYFPELGGERPTIDEFQEALRQEAAGGAKRFTRDADPEAMRRFEARRSAQAQADEYGSRFEEPMDPEEWASLQQHGFEAPAPGYGGRGAPQYEPALQEAPTAGAWIRVKQALDKLVERDPLTGRVIRTGKQGLRNQDLETAANDLRTALAGDETGAGAAIPGYRKALDVSGDYKSMEGAYSRAKGQLTRGSAAEFKRFWDSLKTDAEKHAARSAIANDVLEMWGRGQLKGGKFLIPDVQQNLERAFGKDGAREFIQRAEAEAQLLASGQRAAPFSGSQTAPLLEQAAEQDARLIPQDLSRIWAKLSTGKLAGAAVDALGTAVGTLWRYGKTAGSSEAVRDELGRILQMSPQEAQAFLKSWERLGPATKTNIARQLGLVGAGLGGRAAE